MADDTKAETPPPKIVPQTGEATVATVPTGSPVAGQRASAPPTGAKPPATPHTAEPAQQFKVGFPNEYGMGVDERWKEKFGIWLVRTADDVAAHSSGFYALISTCTHLGCTPNYLSAENKFKCPCHGSGFRLTGINFEGPAPRPLERARVVLSDDGQILVDKSRHFQFELGQWTDPEAFLKV